MVPLSRSSRMLATRLVITVALASASPASAWAQNAISISSVQFDRPTLMSLGVLLPFSGDANENASVEIDYRVATVGGGTTWRSGLNLWRVHPEVVSQQTVAQTFAGSLFDLAPGTSYDIALTVKDDDGVIVDRTPMGTSYRQVISGLTTQGEPVASMTTRPVPRDPVTPKIVNVATAEQLTGALSAAQPGQIIQLAPGTYTGTWQIAASGTPDNPIVIRGANSLDDNATVSSGVYEGLYHDSTILDGDGCTGCNVLEVYGSYVHVEWITIQHATRAIRSYNATTANVYRRLHTRDTDYGIMGANSGGPQTDFYIADNTFEGRIMWPTMCTFSACDASSVDGIGIWGSGHVVSHNRLSGFGDAMANWGTGARANDFYGNDVVWNYDDGIELDGSEGNVRFFRNRIANSWEGVSLQPINGGPAYIFRNIGINIQNEELKIHPYGTDPTSGFLALNNTFASSSFGHAWNNQSSAPCYYFVVMNNVFQGPVPLTANEVDVNCHQTYGTGGVIDYNGYSTDGGFDFYLSGYPGYSSYVPPCAWNGGYGNVFFCSFADLKAYSPFEHNGQVIARSCAKQNGSVFESCFLPPADNTELVGPQDLALASGSSTIAALPLPNINDADSGQDGPSLGAVEAGCAAAIYGPRPPGLDETSSFTCAGYGVPSRTTSTTLTSSPNPSVSGAAVTFSASVQAAAAVPTGDVSFLDSNVAVATVPLDSTGHATYTTSTLTVGSHAVTAAYSGSDTLDASTSTVVTQVVNPPVAITLSASPLTATATKKRSASYTITITPTGGFTGNVTLSVSGMPSKSTAKFRPNPVTVKSASPVSSTLTVSVSQPTPKGTFLLTVRATGTGVVATTSVQLQVQ